MANVNLNVGRGSPLLSISVIIESEKLEVISVTLVLLVLQVHDLWGKQFSHKP